MEKNAVVTTNGEGFSEQDHADMAWLVYRRFGRDGIAAAAAWRRLLQNNCTDAQFRELMLKGER